MNEVLNEATIEVLIAGRAEPAPDIVVLDLVSPDGASLPPFEPGAHVDLHIAPGLVRQYSLCSRPSDVHRYRLAVLRDPASRGGSAAIHEKLRLGDRVRIGIPRNRFALAEAADHAVLVGGGIGVTPLLAMAHHLAAASRSFALHYCVRSRDRAAFLAELDRSDLSDHVHLHFSADGERFRPEQDLPPAAPGTHLYVCGPTGFMDAVIAGARARGYAGESIHREFFGTAIDQDGDAFDVVLARTGRTITVPAGQTIVQALAAAGVRVDVSCEEGVCGTCLCAVLEGVPDHRDVYLTDAEKAANDQMTLCCSRARTPHLVLDL